MGYIFCSRNHMNYVSWKCLKPYLKAAIIIKTLQGLWVHYYHNLTIPFFNSLQQCK